MHIRNTSSSSSSHNPVIQKIHNNLADVETTQSRVELNTQTITLTLCIHQCEEEEDPHQRKSDEVRRSSSYNSTLQAVHHQTTAMTPSDAGNGNTFLNTITIKLSNFKIIKVIFCSLIF
ncbi:uncharacterized [Tachysurus ichikawai]